MQMLQSDDDEGDEEDQPVQEGRRIEALGITREDQTGKADIRSLKDGEGRTAEQLAAERGGIWSDWLGSGRLSI